MKRHQGWRWAGIGWLVLASGCANPLAKPQDWSLTRNVRAHWSGLAGGRAQEPSTASTATASSVQPAAYQQPAGNSQAAGYQPPPTGLKAAAPTGLRKSSCTSFG